MDGKGMNMRKNPRKFIGTPQLIYTLTITITLILLSYPVGLPITISSSTRNLFNTLNNLLKPGDVVLIDLYYSPGSRAELESQLAAVSKFLFEKECKIVFLATHPNGPLVYTLFQALSSDIFYKKDYGKDYAFLGYIAGGEAAVASLAKDIRKTTSVDNYGNLLDNLEIFSKINSAKDFSLAYILADATDVVVWYVRQWYTPYAAPLLIGALSIIAPGLEPYVRAGQSIGMISGTRGAAEFEILVNRKGLGLATMDAQSFVHAMLIIFILIGNFQYLIVKLRERRKGGKDR